MNFPVNATILDIVFIVFIVVMLLIGYIKGFVVRLYDFLATLVALLLSLFLSGPLNDMFHLYTTSGMMSIIGVFINRMFLFGILFSIFRLLFFILGRFIKPGLKSVVSKLSFIEKFDRLLGVILSFIEVLLISYLVLLLSVSPIFSDGKEVVDDTIVAKQVLKIAPSLSDKVMQMTDDFILLKEVMEQGINYDTSPQSISLMTSLLSGAKNFEMLSKEDMETLIYTYIDTLDDLKEPIVIDQATYQSLQDLIKQIDTTNIDIENVFEKIQVSE
jgi:uncharacterized membrane protein required for colicin V production